MMNEPMTNPWMGMPPGTQRRVAGETIHDVFWVNGADGRYGLYISTSEYFSERAWLLSLRGIDVVRRRGATALSGDYLLILRDSQNWEIFVLLCRDLISVAQRHMTARQLVGHMERRLRKWQQLLQKDIAGDLSLEVQMGLFAELLFLVEQLFPRIGPMRSLESWRGPEGDKQDFSFDNSAVEVKSHITTKGPTVWISSLHQLWSKKPKLWLLCYSLATSETGSTIEEVVTRLRDQIGDETEILDILDFKLKLFGYIAEVHHDRLVRFRKDAAHLYGVEEGFPRISPEAVAPAITSLKYAIDLGHCSQFECPLDDLPVGI